ncbi:MAG: alanine-zipper protein [Gammaproteobacteria bacterium]|nr:alanine-zipper protein [Gammaproteobacteria bacterium]
MQQTLSLTVRMAVIGVLLGALSACATVKPEQQLSAVEAKANSAMSEARSAASAAKAAMDAAGAAADAAAKAQSTADAAMACCSENKDRIERMFEQTMKK